VSRSDWAALVETAASVIWPSASTTVPPGDEVQVACSCLRVRGSRLLRACARLVGAGYSTEAAVLVRSIWEDAVSAAFMAEKPVARATRWVDFADARRVHHLKQAIQDPWGLSTDDVAAMVQAVDGKACATSSDWAGTSASSLAKGLASSKRQMSRTLSRDFSLMYEDLCDVAHGSPFAVGQLLTDDGESALVDVGPSDRDTSDVASLAVYAACQLAAAVNAMGAGIDQDLVDGLTSDLLHTRAKS